MVESPTPNRRPGERTQRPRQKAPKPHRAQSDDFDLVAHVAAIRRWLTEEVIMGTTSVLLRRIGEAAIRAHEARSGVIAAEAHSTVDQLRQARATLAVAERALDGLIREAHQQS